MRLSLRALGASIVFFLLSSAAIGRPLLRFSAPSGASVAIASYEYELSGPDEKAVSLDFAASDAERLRDLMRLNLGVPIELRVGEAHAILPTVRSVPDGNGLRITLPDAKAFEALKRAFTTESRTR